MNKKTKNVAIIVAHPDDETLWTGGTILNNPDWQCFIVSLCRKNDPDRAPKFEKVLNLLDSQGIMGDMDDGPEQNPLPDDEVQQMILKLLPVKHYDLIITHSIYGEYTRHRRHEEIGRAIIQLWHSGKLSADKLWAFAYEDGGRKYHPVIIETAPVSFSLSHDIWKKKYTLITTIYGFREDSWEAQTTPKEEAFWEFDNAKQAHGWEEESRIKIFK